MTGRPINLALAADERYVGHAAASIHSFLAHRGALELHVYFLHGEGFAPDLAHALTTMVTREGGQITFLPVGRDRSDGLPAASPFSIEMWFRIFLPELLSHDERVLYVDADTIATDSIEPLWHTDLGDTYLAAVTNVFQHNHLHRPGELGLAGPEVYFNSGVLLLNLELMRRDGCTQAMHELALERGAELEWPDQDVLNLVLGSRRLALHPRWNCMNGTLRFPTSVDVFGKQAVEEARRWPGIRHFEGPNANKPWHRGCERDMHALYSRHRRATPWPDFELEGTPSRLPMRRLTHAVGSRFNRRTR